MGLCPGCVFGVGLDAGRAALADRAEVPDRDSGVESAPAAPSGGGRRFGKYELIERIGDGGMGVLYRAWDTVAKRHVALKMILGGDMASAEALHRFREEAEAAARLDHLHIVPLLGTGEHEGWPYFTMKLMSGGSLAEHGGLYRSDPRQAAELVEKIARAVHHAHQRGILHRDLKPATILLDDAGEPHVADFGIAKHVHKEDGLTETGTVLGTASYMAPEQANGHRKAVTTSVDVYGLGAILYELCTGRPPFVGETSASILEDVKNTRPDALRTLEPNVDRDLQVICLKCLEKNPKHR